MFFFHLFVEVTLCLFDRVMKISPSMCQGEWKHIEKEGLIRTLPRTRGAYLHLTDVEKKKKKEMSLKNLLEIHFSLFH